MSELRNATRYKASAKVKIQGAAEGEIALKDLSVTGCRVESADFSEIELNKQYIIEVLPEKNANIGAFDLMVESMWMRPGDNSYQVGFSIIASPKGKLFQRYVDYLSWRHSQGSSIDGDGASENPPTA